MRNILAERRAHTMAELLVASVVIVILFTATLGAFVLTKNVYSGNIAAYNLQRDVDGLLARITRGIQEQGSSYGLRSGVSYTIPAASPASSRIDFKGVDDLTRSYFLSNNTVVYSSPTQSPAQQVIYTPPPSSTITLGFANVSVDQQVVYIYIAVSQQIGNRTIVGSIATNVNLRNAPK
ncbi:MAG: hypothetical protein WC404_06555 [Candidatus Omnitrophota bacterium]|jgi:hypothetical protein